MDSVPFNRVIRVVVLNTDVVQAHKKMQTDLQKARLDPVVSLGCLMPSGQVVLYSTMTNSVMIWESLARLSEVLSSAKHLVICVDASLIQEADENALVC